jgi:hypothetical protein
MPSWRNQKCQMANCRIPIWRKTTCRPLLLQTRQNVEHSTKCRTLIGLLKDRHFDMSAFCRFSKFDNMSFDIFYFGKYIGRGQKNRSTNFVTLGSVCRGKSLAEIKLLATEDDAITIPFNGFLLQTFRRSSSHGVSLHRRVIGILFIHICIHIWTYVPMNKTCSNLRMY